ncbi:amino acid transporter [Kribbella rubisoli]|uniref:Amino acid transporter n=1 Tax=Kribbella rubisoli TaxID=3075929 RepID=A0A4Q7WJA4_9ACTN|nr:APC family permease [Kribbella rubisoli]RZU10214.1 amino acid transporter [Kribbella rubisoli]
MTTSSDDRHRLGVAGGLAAPSLDAMASVAYGPEAIVLVLALGGSAALGLTLPITIAIAVLLLVLVLSYRQVIAAFPDGGGSYGVAKAHLGRRASLVAAASLVIDYVLNVAVSVAAGVAALTSAVPGLYGYRVELALAVLFLVTAVNLRGVATSARLCAALTGVEAIANAVPSFRKPGVVRAQRAELALGGLLGVMLIGLAILIEKFDIRPVDGVTVLSQLTDGALGHGFGYYVVQFTTVLLLALAANTSFGGLPVLSQLLAKDNYLPHVFQLRGQRQVYRYGILFLAGVSAVLLIAARGDMNTLVPLFAIGVFVGFTLSQAGMVRHWWHRRPPQWRGKLALNGFGALLTGVAAIVVTASKFADGAWLIAITLPVLVLVMESVNRNYRRIGDRLELGHVPDRLTSRRSRVVVPVHGVSRLTGEALSVARGLGHDVVAVHAVNTADPEDTKAFVRLLDDWQRWQPGIPLIALYDQRRTLTAPVVQYVNRCEVDTVFVVIPEIEPDHLWQRLLQNQRGAILAHALRRRTDAVVCRMRFRIDQPTCTQGRWERLGSARLSTSRVTGGTSPSPEMR